MVKFFIFYILLLQTLDELELHPPEVALDQGENEKAVPTSGCRLSAPYREASVDTEGN